MKKKAFIVLSFIFAFVLMSASAFAQGAVKQKQSDTIYDIIDEALRQEEQRRQDSITASQKPKSSKMMTLEPAVERIIQSGKGQERMNLEFEATSLGKVLNSIAEVAGINMVLDPELAEKKIDLHLKDVPAEEALSLIFSAHNLGSSPVGNSLYISHRDKIKKEASQVCLIKLENLSVENAQALIKDLAQVANISKEINTMTVMGTPDQISQVQEILKKADVPQSLVVMETKIIEINRDALKELGVDWSDALNINFQEAKRAADPADPLDDDSAKSAFKVFTIGRNALSFDASVKMLESKNLARILSNPRVTTLNNKEAEIFVGDRIPYTITTVTGGVASTEVRFSEPGIRLKITPSIIESGFVVIKIEPEVSYIYTWRGPDDQYPWIKTREATAYVRVKNNETFVLGGLLTNEDKQNLYQVPFLGKLPLLGNLFSYHKNTNTDSELIITVTPVVISSVN